jgi:hypothetical protein
MDEEKSQTSAPAEDDALQGRRGRRADAAHVSDGNVETPSSSLAIGQQSESRISLCWSTVRLY